MYWQPHSVKGPDAFLIVCTITSSPAPPLQPPSVPRLYVPRDLLSSVGTMLDDPAYSDIEFFLPRRGRSSLHGAKTIKAAKKLLQRVEYFNTSASWLPSLSAQSNFYKCSTPDSPRRQSLRWDSARGRQMIGVPLLLHLLLDPMQTPTMRMMTLCSIPTTIKVWLTSAMKKPPSVTSPPFLLSFPQISLRTSLMLVSSKPIPQSPGMYVKRSRIRLHLVGQQQLYYLQIPPLNSISPDV